jgi:hypothetical protein
MSRIGRHFSGGWLLEALHCLQSSAGGGGGGGWHRSRRGSHFSAGCTALEALAELQLAVIDGRGLGRGVAAAELQDRCAAVLAAAGFDALVEVGLAARRWRRRRRWLTGVEEGAALLGREAVLDALLELLLAIVARCGRGRGLAHVEQRGTLVLGCRPSRGRCGRRRGIRAGGRRGRSRRARAARAWGRGGAGGGACAAFAACRACSRSRRDPRPTRGERSVGSLSQASKLLSAAPTRDRPKRCRDECMTRAPL